MAQAIFESETRCQKIHNEYTHVHSGIGHGHDLDVRGPRAVFLPGATPIGFDFHGFADVLWLEERTTAGGADDLIPLNFSEILYLEKT